ncbi:MAG: molybdenum cofactor biosynthesis protein [Paenibacillaceae bacterium ZCTH02-B3]|nr:MAG: molybdenum cofactor biosynthesis protein [Paenibacillaceae bacterium ZCTH02-B3]
MRWQVALLVTCKGGVRTAAEEESAQVIRELVEEELGGVLREERVVPDERIEIQAALIEIADYYRPHLVLTIGGSGVGPRDHVPEATMLVVDRIVPGMAEAMRRTAMRRMPEAMLHRGVCGIRGGTLIINLPGDPHGVHEHFSAILGTLPAALAAVSAAAPAVEEAEGGDG